MMQAMEIFDLLRMLVFVLPGNHDVVYEACCRVWWETVGRPEKSLRMTPPEFWDHAICFWWMALYIMIRRLIV